MSVKYIFFDLVPSSTSGTLFVSSRVKTLEKNAFKTSALSISSFTNTPSPLSKGLIPVVCLVFSWTYFQKNLGLDLQSFAICFSNWLLAFLTSASLSFRHLIYLLRSYCFFEIMYFLYKLFFFIYNLLHWSRATSWGERTKPRWKVKMLQIFFLTEANELGIFLHRRGTGKILHTLCRCKMPWCTALQLTVRVQMHWTTSSDRVHLTLCIDLDTSYRTAKPGRVNAEMWSSCVISSVATAWFWIDDTHIIRVCFKAFCGYQESPVSSWSHCVSSALTN